MACLGRDRIFGEQGPATSGHSPDRFRDKACLSGELKRRNWARASFLRLQPACRMAASCARVVSGGHWWGRSCGCPCSSRRKLGRALAIAEECTVAVLDEKKLVDADHCCFGGNVVAQPNSGLGTGVECAKPWLSRKGGDPLGTPSPERTHDAVFIARGQPRFPLRTSMRAYHSLIIDIVQINFISAERACWKIAQEC